MSFWLVDGAIISLGNEHSFRDVFAGSITLILSLIPWPWDGGRASLGFCESEISLLSPSVWNPGSSAPAAISAAIPRESAEQPWDTEGSDALCAAQFAGFHPICPECCWQEQWDNWDNCCCHSFTINLHCYTLFLWDLDTQKRKSNASLERRRGEQFSMDCNSLISCPVVPIYPIQK